MVIIKGQGGEQPIKNWELLERLDPKAPHLTYEDWGKMFHPTGEGLVVRDDDMVLISGQLFMVDSQTYRRN